MRENGYFMDTTVLKTQKNVFSKRPLEDRPSIERRLSNILLQITDPTKISTDRISSISSRLI